jgi:hypothetical protein
VTGDLLTLVVGAAFSLTASTILVAVVIASVAIASPA